MDLRKEIYFYANLAAFPATGALNCLYVASATGIIYTWNGSSYVASGPGPVPTGLNYQGLWDANANLPLITSSVGTVGNYYIVGTAGTTNINGINDWGVGDWIVFSSTGVWQKIDNSDKEGYATIEDEGNPLTQRSTINFVGAGVSAADSGGKTVVTIAAGGLTKFTEAENTSAPNGTVYVDSLTAAASSTNADIAIVPKGTGAFMLDIPDNASTGGNKRGAGAVDLQTARNSANHVASGANSFSVGTSNESSGSHSITLGTGNASTSTASAAIGSNSNATNTASMAFGTSANATGVTSVSMGSGVTASGTSAFCVGQSSTASGQFSACIGQASSATAERAYVIGSESIANAAYSMSFGFYTHTFGIVGRHAYSNYPVAVVGDSQYSKFILKRRTTGNTATTLTTDNGAAGAANQVILSNQSAYGFTGTIVGKQSGSTNAAMWKVEGLIVRGANAASTVLTTSTVTLVSNAPGWGTPTLAADTTNGGLQVQVIGATTTNIQWTAVIETTEVIYA